MSALKTVHEHGRLAVYKRGCRCDLCRAVKQEAAERYRKRRKERMRE